MPGLDPFRVIIGAGGVEKIIDIKLTPVEQKMFDHSGFFSCKIIENSIFFGWLFSRCSQIVDSSESVFGI